MINDRINQLIQVLDQNPNSFSENIGVKAAVVYNIIRGRRNKPSFDVLNKILDRFDEVNSEWLIRGNGDILDHGKKEHKIAVGTKKPSIRSLQVSVQRRIYELLDTIKAENLDSPEFEELGELINHMIKENENQKVKILDLYEKNAGMVDVLRKKLDLNI